MTNMAPFDYEIVARVPSVDDYVRLRRVTKLGERSPEAAAMGLPNTWFGLVVKHGEEVIGMGRVIGDGGCFFQITDIAVDPRHQGRGLGKAIMSALMEHLRAHAPKSAYVSLIADGDACHLYAQFGFEPTAPRSIGMALRIG